MHTAENATTPLETSLQTPPAETETNENSEQPIANATKPPAHTGEPLANENLQLQTPAASEPAPVNENKPLAHTGEPPANNNEPVVQIGKRVAYNCHLSFDEDAHIQPMIDDLIKFGVVENKADFIRKAIDVYINYNNVCTENKLEQPLIIPVPDGKNGSIAVTPKLLRNSLFKSLSKLPTF